MIFKIILILLLLIAAYIAWRIYGFLKATDAPILKGKIKRNISYKKGKSLDLYFPINNQFGKTPVLVHFHGGAWVMGSKLFVNNARFHGAFNGLREKGYAIISPKYTLAKKGQSPFPACLEDAHDALAWVEKNADKYNFDLKNIGVMGESAGAHIALMLGFTKAEQFSSSHFISPNYVVDVYGPAEMYSLYKAMSPFLDNMENMSTRWPSILRSRFNIKENLFGFNPLEDENRTSEFAARFSPVKYLNENAPKILIIHGSHDQLVPISQSEILMKKLKENNLSFEFHLLRGVGHAFRGASYEQREKVQKWVYDFVVKNYADEKKLIS